MIEWNRIDKYDAEKISILANRWHSTIPGYDLITCDMDLTACHITTPLRLDAMLTDSGYDVFHDIAGIRANINRSTGKLDNCFLPRYAANQ